MNSSAEKTLLEVTDLKTYFKVGARFLGRRRVVRAADGVSFRIHRGRTLGLVGESGSGKTTVGRTILRLIRPTGGQVVFDGHNIFNLSHFRLRRLRQAMQMIFQDPVGSLNPRMTAGKIIEEPLHLHTSLSVSQRRARVGELLERVGLPPQAAGRYPHEFSGGQRQRIGIARALAPDPSFIVCDEPVSALDVSIQAQILNLLKDLQQQFGLTYLFIAHNLAVVEHFADEVAVMYLGRIVERAPAATLYASPAHPYTESLLAAVPYPDPKQRTQRRNLPGETPSPVAPPSGCPFHPRCPLTRQLASTMPVNETRTILSEDEAVPVVRRCVEETPSLLPTSADGAHHHACLMRR